MVAASLIGLLFLIWQPSKISNTEAPELFADISPERVKWIEIENQYRGIEYLVPGMNFENSQKVAEALIHFENGDFEKSATILELIENIREYPDILLYLAISQVNSNRNSVAIENLRFLLSLANFDSHELASYYLSVAYVQNGNIIKARKVLRKIVREKQNHHEKASEVLSKLRLF